MNKLKWEHRRSHERAVCFHGKKVQNYSTIATFPLAPPPHAALRRTSQLGPGLQVVGNPHSLHRLTWVLAVVDGSMYTCNICVQICGQDIYHSCRYSTWSWDVIGGLTLTGHMPRIRYIRGNCAGHMPRIRDEQSHFAKTYDTYT